MEDRMKQVMNLVNNLNQEVYFLKGQLKVKDSELVQIGAKNDSLSLAFRSVMTENDTLKTEIIFQKEKLDSTQKDLESALSNNDRLDEESSKVEEMVRKIDDLKIQLSKSHELQIFLTEENAKSEEKAVSIVKEFELKLQTARETIENLTKENMKLTEGYKDLENKMKLPNTSLENDKIPSGDFTPEKQSGDLCISNGNENSNQIQSPSRGCSFPQNDDNEIILLPNFEGVAPQSNYDAAQQPYHQVNEQSTYVTFIQTIEKKNKKRVMELLDKSSKLQGIVSQQQNEVQSLKRRVVYLENSKKRYKTEAQQLNLQVQQLQKRLELTKSLQLEILHALQTTSQTELNVNLLVEKVQRAIENENVLFPVKNKVKVEATNFQTQSFNAGGKTTRQFNEPAKRRCIKPEPNIF